MRARVKVLGSLIGILLMMVTANQTTVAGESSSSGVRQAIERTQAMVTAITRCASADEKFCAEGLAFAKLAKEASESAARSDELSSAAKSNVQIAVQRLIETIGFLEQGRNSEAITIGNNALSALYEADKTS